MAKRQNKPLLPNTKLVVWPDTIQSDRQYVGLIGMKDCQVQADDFVLITDMRYEYFAKIEGRPANFSPALGRDDPASFSAIAKKLIGEIKTMALEEHNLLHYNARLIQQAERWGYQEIAEVLTAPALGAEADRASAMDVVRFLGLPSMHAPYKIGQIFHTAVPLCLSLEIMIHHLLLAGATGQGKTTLISNCVAACAAMGATIVLFDLKPDYQSMEETPHDVALFRYPSSVPQLPRPRITYWNLNEPRPYRADSLPINVRFSDLDPEAFAGKAAGSDTQYIVWSHMLLWFVDRMRRDGKQHWTLRDFHAWMPKNKAEANKMTELYPYESSPHESTLDAHYRVARAKPSWVDRGGTAPQRGGLGTGIKTPPFFFESPQFLQPGHVHVIQTDPAIDRDYGLFVTTLLKRISREKAEKAISHPVILIIDEAEDIFSGPEFARASVRTLAGIIRKGRSQNIGVVLSVQSAMSVPANIAQNLNTIVAFRHNDDDAAGHIKKILGKDAANLQNLEKGQALIRFFQAKAVVRAALDREAFQLVVTK
jgi:hypothetical protein